MSDRPHPSLGELVPPDESYAFVALVELMDSLGCRFIVKLPDGLGADGPPLPAWCDEVVATWFDFIVSAYAGVASGHHVYACTECCFPMLLTSVRKGRTCPVCGAKHAVTYRPPIHFVDPPARRKPAPKRPRQEPPPAPPDGARAPTAWPNCGHSLASLRPDGTYLCSYCNEVIPFP